MSLQEVLIKKIVDRSAIIGIVELGYVGQPLALRFVEQGFSVVGFDIDVKKVAALNSGHQTSSILRIQRSLRRSSRGCSAPLTSRGR